MSAQQLHLLAPAKPLLERFGAEFFRAVPPRPGVYIMGDHSERVLYIGQSKNLRHRLGSYKNARPNHTPRKIIRLVHLVRTLVWEECATAEAARLKENELLRVHRPKFNVMNTWPSANGFVGLEAQPGQLILRLSNEAKLPGRLYGAFKSGYLRAGGALLRLLWAAACKPATVFDFPALLLREKPPREYCLNFLGASAFPSPCWPDLLERFFTGESPDLISALTGIISTAETQGVFQRNFLANDIEIITHFFERGPKRIRELRRRHAIPDGLLAQEELDDLLVIDPPSPRPRSDAPTIG